LQASFLSRRAYTPVNSEVTANEFRYSNTEPIGCRLIRLRRATGKRLFAVRCGRVARRSRFKEPNN